MAAESLPPAALRMVFMSCGRRRKDQNRGERGMEEGGKGTWEGRACGLEGVQG